MTNVKRSALDAPATIAMVAHPPPERPQPELLLVVAWFSLALLCWLYVWSAPRRRAVQRPAHCDVHPRHPASA